MAFNYIYPFQQKRSKHTHTQTTKHKKQRNGKMESFVCFHNLQLDLGEKTIIWIVANPCDQVCKDYPGEYKLQTYNPSFLKILNFAWFPRNGGGGGGVVNNGGGGVVNNGGIGVDDAGTDDRPSLSISVEAIQRGVTQLIATVQPDSFNPLFIEVNYTITIV